MITQQSDVSNTFGFTMLDEAARRAVNIVIDASISTRWEKVEKFEVVSVKPTSNGYQLRFNYDEQGDISLARLVYAKTPKGVHWSLYKQPIIVIGDTTCLVDFNLGDEAKKALHHLNNVVNTMIQHEEYKSATKQLN